MILFFVWQADRKWAKPYNIEFNLIIAYYSCGINSIFGEDVPKKQLWHIEQFQHMSCKSGAQQWSVVYAYH